MERLRRRTVMNQDRKLRAAVWIVGVFVSLFAGWCAWRLALSGTKNDADAVFYFGLMALLTGAAFLHWIWDPLLRVLEQRRRR